MSQRHTEQNQPDHPRIAELKQQRQAMLDSGTRIRLEEQFNIYEILPSSHKYFSSIFGPKAEAIAEAWARENNVWLEGISDDTNTMSKELHSNASSLTLLVDNTEFYLILFDVDDEFGNDRQSDKTPEQLTAFKIQIKNVGEWLINGTPYTPTGNIEKTVDDVFKRFKANSTPEWYAKFKKACVEHLELAIENQNSNHTKKIHTVESFNQSRVKIAGMYTSILLDMYATQQFLSDNDVEKYGFTKKLERLHYLCALICSYLNEFFSLEREVIDDNTDYNLIAILMLNDDDLTLESAIDLAIKLTNEYIKEFVEVKEEIRTEISLRAEEMEERMTKGEEIEENETLRAEYKLYATLVEHLVGIEDFINAAWFWQVVTKRYQREDTIFYETLPEYRAQLAAKFEDHWAGLKNGINLQLVPGLEQSIEIDDDLL